MTDSHWHYLVTDRTSYLRRNSEKSARGSVWYCYRFEDETEAHDKMATEVADDLTDHRWAVDWERRDHVDLYRLFPSRLDVMFDHKTPVVLRRAHSVYECADATCQERDSNVADIKFRDSARDSSSLGAMAIDKKKKPPPPLIRF